MNKNTRARRMQALKNFHSKNNPASETSFQVVLGGGQTATWRVPIGFVQPKAPKRKAQVVASTEEAVGEVTVVTTTRSGKQVTVPKK